MIVTSFVVDNERGACDEPTAGEISRTAGFGGNYSRDTVFSS